jgi:hypothetical protein
MMRKSEIRVAMRLRAPEEAKKNALSKPAKELLMDISIPTSGICMQITATDSPYSIE